MKSFFKKIVRLFVPGLLHFGAAMSGLCLSFEGSTSVSESVKGRL